MVLTKPSRHLTTKASIESNHITYASLDIISILIVRFGDLAYACRVQTIRNELAAIQQKFLGYVTNCLITVCRWIILISECT